MMTLPNLLSLSRLFFAALLLIENSAVRAIAIILAGASDFLDGYFARKWGQKTTLGTILDPITDKCFVALALALFFVEEKLTVQVLSIFLLREISLLFFTALLFITKTQKNWKIRSFYAGKLMTTVQFITLFLLGIDYPVPFFLYVFLAICGIGSFFELVYLRFKEKLSMSRR